MNDGPLQVTITGGVHSLFDFSQAPPGTLERFNEMLATSEAMFDHDLERAGELWGEALDYAEPYRRDRGPDPANANPHPPELIEDQSDAIAVCTSPDVCRTPVGSSTPPIPYMVTGQAGDDSNYTTTVRSNGLAVAHAASEFTTTYGDEAGTARGVVSGTVGDVVEPTGASSVVRVEGNPIIRHRDPCTLNAGNCPGEYIHVESTQVDLAPDATDAAERAWYGRFWDEFYGHSGTAQDVDSALDRLGDYWDDPSQIGSDLQAAWDAVPSPQEAWDWTRDAAEGVAGVASDVWDDPGGAAEAAWDWTTETAQDVADGTAEVYDRSGVIGVLGAGVGILGEVVSPSQRVRAGQAAVDALDEAGDLARVADGDVLPPGRRRDDDGDGEGDDGDSDGGDNEEPPERRTEEDGEDGARSTRDLSLREQYLGRTPGKYSRTGREVRERMRREGTLRENELGQDEFLGEDGLWHLVDSPDTHMGHHPVDAVDYWNETGRFYGPRSPEVREWMLDPDNYRFEHGPLNSARGGATTSRYLPPVTE